MLVKPEHVEVMLDVFSGQPNPSWLVTVSQMAAILEKIQNLPSAESVTRNNLGYRGFVISNVSQLKGIPEKIVAFRGVIGFTAAGKTKYYRDTNHVEEYLQDMAREMGHGETLDHYLRPVK